MTVGPLDKAVDRAECVIPLFEDPLIRSQGDLTNERDYRKRFIIKIALRRSFIDNVQVQL